MTKRRATTTDALPLLRGFAPGAVSAALVALLRARAHSDETANDRRLDRVDGAIAAFASRRLGDVAVKLRFLAQESGYLDGRGRWRAPDGLEARLLRAATRDLERLIRL